MKITYWSDYACPYCYIGEARLKSAIKELKLEDKIELEMKAFQLDPGAPEKSNGTTLDRFAAKYGLSKSQAAQQIENISQMGRDEGLEFNYATTLFTNTMDAHRLTKYACEKDAAIGDKLIEALFKAYFSDNKELADHDVLMQYALDSGLSEDEIKEVLASDKYKDEVILDEREAARYGIHAVPFFVVGKYGIPGALSTEQMKATIMKTMEEESDMPKAQGMTCGEDGCRIG